MQDLQFSAASWTLHEAKLDTLNKCNPFQVQVGQAGKETEDIRTDSMLPYCREPMQLYAIMFRFPGALYTC